MARAGSVRSSRRCSGRRDGQRPGRADAGPRVPDRARRGRCRRRRRTRSTSSATRQRPASKARPARRRSSGAKCWSGVNGGQGLPRDQRRGSVPAGGRSATDPRRGSRGRRALTLLSARGRRLRATSPAPFTVETRWWGWSNGAYADTVCAAHGFSGLWNCRSDGQGPVMGDGQPGPGEDPPDANGAPIAGAWSCRSSFASSGTGTHYSPRGTEARPRRGRALHGQARNGAPRPIRSASSTARAVPLCGAERERRGQLGRGGLDARSPAPRGPRGTITIGGRLRGVPLPRSGRSSTCRRSRRGSGGRQTTRARKGARPARVTGFCGPGAARRS